MRVVVQNWFGQALCLFLLCLSHAARAEPSSAEIAVARRLFKEAVALEERGRWAEAAQTLREAIAIKDTPGLRFHLANAEVEQGHLVEAVVEYDRADELIAAGESAPDVARLLATAREELKKRVPTVHVVGLASDAGVTLTIDGRKLASSLLAHPIPQNPGRHKIVVESAGHQRAVFEVDLVEGERRQIQVNIAKPEPKAGVRQVSTSESLTTEESPSLPEPPPVQPRKHGGSIARTVVVVSEVLITAAGLGVGAGFLLNQNSIDTRSAALNRELSEIAMSAPQDASVCGMPGDALTAAKCSEFRQTLVDSKQARDLATAGFVGAGVGAVATVITLIVWDTSGAEASASKARSGWQATLSPLGLQGLHATIQTRW